MFRRLICCIKGHAPFPKVKVEPVPPPDPNTILIGGPGTFLSTNGLGGTLWTTPSEMSGLTVTRGPYEGTMSICHRCKGVYWTVAPKASLITPHLPELTDYNDWRKRNAWEEKQRQKNPLAAKLYKQYQVALKLAQPTEDDQND